LLDTSSNLLPQVSTCLRRLWSTFVCLQNLSTCYLLFVLVVFQVLSSLVLLIYCRCSNWPQKLHLSALCNVIMSTPGDHQFYLEFLTLKNFFVKSRAQLIQPEKCVKYIVYFQKKSPQKSVKILSVKNLIQSTFFIAWRVDEP